ncbi:unnamed protein product [Larinioides sclopetarius]
MCEEQSLLPFQMNFLPVFVLQKAVSELNETPDRRMDGIKVLKELLSSKWDPEKFSIDDFKRLVLLLFIQTLRDPMTQINGFKVIHDFKGTSIKHLRHCTPQNLIFQYHAAIFLICTTWLIVYPSDSREFLMSSVPKSGGSSLTTTLSGLSPYCSLRMNSRFSFLKKIQGNIKDLFSHETMSKENNEQACYPLHITHIPEYFYEKAQKELNETLETREVELSKLKKLLSADKLTSDIKFEEDFLHQFLRHRKYDSLKAFQYLKKYINFRRSHSSMFLSVPEEDFRGNPSIQLNSLLPYRCPDGCVIILCEFGNSSKNSWSCIPARFKELHFINKSAFLSAMWAVIKYVVPEKLRKRAFFHSNPEDVVNYFPRSIIPTKYGGSLVNYHDSELLWKMNKDHGNCPEGGQPNYI